MPPRDPACGLRRPPASVHTRWMRGCSSTGELRHLTEGQPSDEVSRGRFSFNTSFHPPRAFARSDDLGQPPETAARARAIARVVRTRERGPRGCLFFGRRGSHYASFPFSRASATSDGAAAAAVACSCSGPGRGAHFTQLSARRDHGARGDPVTVPDSGLRNSRDAHILPASLRAETSTKRIFSIDMILRGRGRFVLKHPKKKNFQALGGAGGVAGARRGADINTREPWRTSTEYF